MYDSIVLGAGVIGVNTAYWLAKAGQKVLVVDRQAATGNEASFGDCSPPFRARLPTSQAATGAWPDLRKPPLAGTDSPSAFSLITP
ncbi:FAD-dependent oxidoreductase, partial [Oceanospirillum multiglobuliferum]|uniref:FAD-dependent oxidoreductase n=1 Tax=Oceanospirillum multiglobuliferum TaxID=64969 RepID=UPI001118586B